jgi:hypothetical protein
MSYVIIEDFRAGLDRRKLAAASPQGSLQTLNNAHITRGGEIEKRLAWVPKYSLPVGKTFGFAGANGALHVFGSDAAPAVPAGVTYTQLAAPGTPAMTRVVSCHFFEGKPWVIAAYADGKRYAFYNGTRIADFDAASGAVAVQGSTPNHALTHNEKVYVVRDSVLAFSGINAPAHFQDSGAGEVGFGFKNMSNQSAGSEALTALGRYQNLLAVFARRNIQTWYLDPDPLENAKRQNLENIGTFAPKSVVPFGDVDVFFLSDSGVRSLRSRDSSNQAGMADVGTPIDEYLLDYLSTLTEDQKERAVGCLEPISGRYILAVGTKCFVFSYFASSRTSAWSTYSLPAEVDDLAAVDGRVWARMGDTLYVLGGNDGKTYDGSQVEVELPYIDGRAIATFKNWNGIDVVCQGEWKLLVNTDPNEPDAESEVAIVNNTSLTRDMIGLVGHSPLIRLRLVNASDGPARLSKIIVHYNPAEAG